eukprot:9788415-Alexandrium_andersonii.AAC.1
MLASGAVLKAKHAGQSRTDECVMRRTLGHCSENALAAQMLATSCRMGFEDARSARRAESRGFRLRSQQW